MKKFYLILLLLFIIFGCKNFNKITLFFYYKDTDNIELFLDGKINIFTKNNPEIQIKKIKKSKNDFLKDLNKNKIDFIRYPSNYLSELVDLKILKPCNDIFEKDFINRISPLAIQSATVQKQLWGIPDNYINYPLLYYNKTIIKEPPKNTNELIKINNQLNYKYNNFGLYINLKEPFFIYPWINGFGATLLNMENIKPNFNQKPVIDALQFIYDLKYKYKIISLNFNQNELEYYITNNNISLVIDGDWSYDFYNKILGNDLGISPVPPIANLEEQNYILISTMCYSIMKTANKRKINAIKKFLNYILSKEIESEWIKKGRLPVTKILETENYQESKIKELYDIPQKSKLYPSKLIMINKALRPQLEKLIDDEISTKYAVKNAQEYLEKIYK